MLDTEIISGEYVCCNVVFGTGVFVFSVIWSQLLMSSAIYCPLWSSVYECQIVDWAFTYPVRLSVVCLSCAVCSVVCPCKLFCIAWDVLSRGGI